MKLIKGKQNLLEGMISCTGFNHRGLPTDWNKIFCTFKLPPHASEGTCQISSVFVHDTADTHAPFTHTHNNDSLIKN